MGRDVSTVECAEPGCERGDALTLKFGAFWCDSHAPRYDPVERPAHYADLVPEPIDALEAWLTIEEFVAHCRATAIVYLVRAGRKDGESSARDLDKARWYADRAVQALKRRPR